VETDFGELLLPGKSARNGFAILGMGKLGGSELNFSSDIDIIFLCEDDEGNTFKRAELSRKILFRVSREERRTLLLVTFVYGWVLNKATLFWLGGRQDSFNRS